MLLALILSGEPKVAVSGHQLRVHYVYLALAHAVIYLKPLECFSDFKLLVLEVISPILLLPVVEGCRILLS